MPGHRTQHTSAPHRGADILPLSTVDVAYVPPAYVDRPVTRWQHLAARRRSAFSGLDGPWGVS